MGLHRRRNSDFAAEERGIVKFDACRNKVQQIGWRDFHMSSTGNAEKRGLQKMQKGSSA